MMLPTVHSHLAMGIVMSHIARISRAVALSLVLLVATRPVGAQSAATAPSLTPAHRWELLFSTGALVPTGVQRRILKDAPLSTGQLSYVMASRLALTTSVGWARSRDLATEGNPRLSVFTYDVGVEARAPRWGGGDALSLMPFAGVGGGGRSFNHRGRDLDATHAPAGYAALGGELAVRRARIRVEARDYVVGMTPLVGGGKREIRNDLSIIAGLRLVKQHASAE
jgi:hypothetical protein